VTKTADNSAAQANLQTTLTGTDTFYTVNNQTYSNLLGGSASRGELSDDGGEL
jgi:hypothetical protein